MLQILRFSLSDGERHQAFADVLIHIFQKIDILGSIAKIGVYADQTDHSLDKIQKLYSFLSGQFLEMFLFYRHRNVPHEIQPFPLDILGHQLEKYKLIEILRKIFIQSVVHPYPPGLFFLPPLFHRSGRHARRPRASLLRFVILLSRRICASS